MSNAWASESFMAVPHELVLREGEGEVEGAALAQFTLNPDTSAVRLYQEACNVQSKSQALPRSSRGPVSPFEQWGQTRRPNPGAPIRSRHERLTGMLLHPHRHL